MHGTSARMHDGSVAMQRTSGRMQRCAVRMHGGSVVVRGSAGGVVCLIEELWA